MQAIANLLKELNLFLLALHINSMYVLLWVAAGYIQSTYCKPFRLSDAWKTLILGSLFSVGYVLLQRPIGQRSTWVEFFASYIFATSLYELLLKDLVNMCLSRIRSFYATKLNAEA